MHGGAIGSDDAVVLRTSRCAKAARYLLLDLEYTHCLFGQVVGERHIGLGHETPDIVAVIAQSANQIGGFALFWSDALN